ncbi:glycosyltransferase family 2 protein [Sulfitobacter albidus]|uniref:Glycosyltransferase family 2 protein n=1 Tax=Sulfitobacter albidus TaxID=2829501 RepID=A0A975PNM4_9RHOB|nr:glycosyltransferase family 2 protein [Sulfitobacter albidus]QUJ77899.1 glycosyltransferase family 2 protein [Sulfitobacter albidus]
MQTWGVVATIKAPAPAILRWAAWHLELGAHRITVYLDDPNPDAQEALRAHPKCRVKRCDDGYWQRQNNGRPAAHQSRQTFNATHGYNRAGDVDWLMHLDVDEFLTPGAPVADQLAALPEGTLTARARPMELLAGGDPATDAAFKMFLPAGRSRERIVAALYPNFGQYLKGGFLSHIAGKLFARTGMQGIKFRIHNAFRGEEMNPNEAPLPDLHLAHFHATDWDSWRAHFDYRLARGSYREGLGPARPRDRGGITANELYTMILDEDGEAGLRRFFDEVCADTPLLRSRLSTHGCLFETRYDFDAALAKHFPDFASI